MLTNRNPSRSAATSALLACGVAGMLTLAACGAGNSQPSWAAGLGTGVTVVAPESVPAGHDSPEAVVTGLAAVTTAKKFVQVCDYMVPANQAGCRSSISQSPVQELSLSNFALGYTAIDGNRAVVGMTGTVCNATQTPKCLTNSDPAAVFSTAKSFSALWSNAIKDSSALTACTKVNGKWYLYTG